MPSGSQYTRSVSSLPVLPARPSRLERPEWLKVRLSTSGEFDEVNSMMRRLNLVTVCEEARCPNIHECWARERTATFMLLGDVCTRHCGFCAVGKGVPGSVDPDEPRRVGEAVAELGLKHAVVTSVNRDDLPDGGAEQFARTIRVEKAIALRHRGATWSEVALACGFADQAHMIHDFRALAGVTPQGFMREAFTGPHAAANRRLALSGFYNTAIV